MLRPARPYRPAAMPRVRAGPALWGSGPPAAMRHGAVGVPVVWSHLLCLRVPSSGVLVHRRKLIRPFRARDARRAGRSLLRWAGGRAPGFCLATLGGGGVNSGTPPRTLAYPQTDKCPTPPPGGGSDTHPPIVGFWRYPLRTRHKSQRILAPLWAWGRHRNCGVLALPPSHPAQITKNPSPFMGVGQTQELWGSGVTPFASGTNHKES